MQTSCRINEEHIGIAGLGSMDGIENNGSGICPLLPPADGDHAAGIGAGHLCGHVNGQLRAVLMIGTENVAAAYAATYPIALIAVVLVSQFLIILF